MTAWIFTVFNQKGGSGKTNLSMQLGGTLARRGYRTQIIDMDPQNTASRHSSAAADGHPFPAKVISLAVHGGKMHREVERDLESFDFIIIDCPPAADSPVPVSTMLIADLALIPVIPSPGDMWATEAAKALVANAQVNNQSLIARVVPSMVRPTSLARELLELFEQDSEIPPTKTIIGLRDAYRDCMLRGTTVHGVPRSQAKAAIEEVEAFTDEVLSLVGMPAKAKKGAKK